MSYIKTNFNNLDEIALNNIEKYRIAKPFPHIIIDDFFKENILSNIIEDFPKDLEKIGDKFNNKTELKFGLNDPKKLSHQTNNFINFLNSSTFINFLQKLTSINETLIPDPYLLGGGLHELKDGGFLNVHADFNFHPTMKLDRRLNILIYLNKDWKIEFGGNLELWDKKMEKCEKKIIARDEI